MKELLKHKAYELLKTTYEKIDLDYVILSVEGEYKGIETHKDAVIKAFEILNTRNQIQFGNEYDYDFEIKAEAENMQAQSVNMDELLQLPDDAYYDNRPKTKARNYSAPKPVTYWYAFLEPPHGVPYVKSDFLVFNDVLFPNKEHCFVYRWNDDFSNYFDAGKEWWGTGLWTIYDDYEGTVVVIGASLTD